MHASSTKTLLPNGTTIVHQNKGETEFVYREIFEDHCYLKHGITVEEGSCVFDVGANIGLFSLYISRLAPTSKVYAFEPLPPLYRLLQENRTLCDLHNLHLFPFGLSSRRGTETFTYYPRNSIMSGRYANDMADRQIVKAYLLNQLQAAGAVDVPPDVLIDSIAGKSLIAERHECQLRTLSEVIAEQNIERIDLLKLDVEKSELDVLQGINCRDWEKIQQLVVEVYDGHGQLSIVEAMLRQHGFSFAVEQDKCLLGSPVHMVYARKG